MKSAGLLGVGGGCGAGIARNVGRDCLQCVYASGRCSFVREGWLGAKVCKHDAVLVEYGRAQALII